VSAMRAPPRGAAEGSPDGAKTPPASNAARE